VGAFMLRNGTSIPADAVFEAWTSGDLSRMLAVRGLPTHPVDRHFLLMGIVGQTYSTRDDPSMRRLCLEVAEQHVSEFPGIAPLLSDDMGGFLPRVPTFAQLATVLAEDGRYDDAVAVCEKAIRWGLHDGTKGDYQGRIARLRQSAEKLRRRVVG